MFRLTKYVCGHYCSDSPLAAFVKGGILITVMILSYQVSPLTTRKASSTGSALAMAPSIDATWTAVALRC